MTECPSTVEFPNQPNWQFLRLPQPHPAIPIPRKCGKVWTKDWTTIGPQDEETHGLTGPPSTFAGRHRYILRGPAEHNRNQQRRLWQEIIIIILGKMELSLSWHSTLSYSAIILEINFIFLTFIEVGPMNAMCLVQSGRHVNIARDPLRSYFDKFQKNESTLYFYIVFVHYLF